MERPMQSPSLAVSLLLHWQRAPFDPFPFRSSEQISEAQNRLAAMETLPIIISSNQNKPRYLENPNHSKRRRVTLAYDDEDDEDDFCAILNSLRSSSLRIPGISSCLKMVAGSMYLPKEDPERPRGEDSHFISLKTQTFGVADGVGGWRKKGIDAGEYSRELMSNCLVALDNNTTVDPQEVLEEAYNNTTSQGSSTACVVTLSGSTLRAVNVGDSGFMVFRRGRLFYQSPVQQKRFNCPYQLGVTRDNPSVAQELEVEVEVGDVIVAGTDGLLDNLFASAIEEIIRQGIKQYGPEELALFIANLALFNSFDKEADTPFSVNAREAGFDHSGGKVDDITVVVAFIV